MYICQRKRNTQANNRIDGIGFISLVQGRSEKKETSQTSKNMITEKTSFICCKPVMWSYMYQIFYGIKKPFLLCGHQGQRFISTVLLSSLFIHCRNMYTRVCYCCFLCLYHSLPWRMFKDNHPLVFAQHCAQCRCNSHCAEGDGLILQKRLRSASPWGWELHHGFPQA